MEMRQPFFGQEVQRQRDARRQADAGGALAQLAQMMIGIGVGSGGKQLAREPEHPLRLMRDHELVHDLLEVGQHLDLGEGFRFLTCHAVQFGGCEGRRLGARSTDAIPPNAVSSASREPFVEKSVDEGFTSRCAAVTFRRRGYQAAHASSDLGAPSSAL